ncbi:hypothetical protein ACL9RF_17330 [Sphingobacterium sp. Mn56C]|uniref:hypothetical protein n=1 Tax=Sphingobacterium sp. Mn56C TaxID=3395261 RepID=UPI003BC04280
MEDIIIDTLRERSIKISSKRAWIVHEICAIQTIHDIELFWISLRQKQPVSWATVHSTLRLLYRNGFLQKTPIGSRSFSYHLIAAA